MSPIRLETPLIHRFFQSAQEGTVTAAQISQSSYPISHANSSTMPSADSAIPFIDFDGFGDGTSPVSDPCLVQGRSLTSLLPMSDKADNVAEGQGDRRALLCRVP